MLETVCGTCPVKKGRRRPVKRKACGVACLFAGMILLFCCAPGWFIAFCFALALLAVGCALLICKR